MTTDKGEDPPDSTAIELDEADLDESAEAQPETRLRAVPIHDELPAGVPPPRRLSKRQLLWGAVPVSVLFICGALKLLAVLDDRGRVERRCVDKLGQASAHLARGDLDLADDALRSGAGECADAYSAQFVELQRKLAAAHADVTAKADHDAKQTAAAREREAVASFQGTSAELRKNLKQAAAFIARGDIEHAAPLVVAGRAALDRVKATSVSTSAGWLELDALDEQLRVKVQPYLDRVQLELDEAARVLKEVTAEDRRDGVKYTRGDHLAALTLEKLELVRRYAAANDKQGLALLVQNDDAIIVLKPSIKVNVIGHGGPGTTFVQIHFRGTTLDMWTTADAIRDP